MHKDIDIRNPNLSIRRIIVSIEADVAILFGEGQYQGYLTRKTLAGKSCYPGL